jgi:hypothetical protein
MRPETSLFKAFEIFDHTTSDSMFFGTQAQGAVVAALSEHCGVNRATMILARGRLAGYFLALRNQGDRQVVLPS